jgi:predicted nucleic-acid-binding protein
MRTAQFEIIDKDTIWHALNDFNESKRDFADYYIGRANKRSGAVITLTFDKVLKDSEMFSVL